MQDLRLSPRPSSTDTVELGGRQQYRSGSLFHAARLGHCWGAVVFQAALLVLQLQVGVASSTVGHTGTQKVDYIKLIWFVMG